MDNNIAFLFPGQGSQSVGMLSEHAKHFPLIINIFKEASDILGYDLWQLIQEDLCQQLNQTAYTQPALLTADVALWRCWLEQKGIQPSVMAGHSLGEYAALVAAGILSFPDALSLVSQRGHLMQEACLPGEGTMAAIVGLDDEQVEEICAKSAQGEVLSPANYNSYGQVVIAGQADAVDRAVMMAKKQDAKLAKVIPVSVPSHCLLMEPAQSKLSNTMKKMVFNPPRVPVLQNRDAQAHAQPECIREALIAQLTQPVRWVQTIEMMLSRWQVRAFIECGPGRVLSGLVKRITPTSKIYSFGIMVQFQEAREVVLHGME